MVFEFWHILIIIILLLNICATIVILRRDDLDKFQIIAQVTLVWLIPVVAAITFWAFHRGTDGSSSNKPPFGGGDNGNGFDPE